MASLIISSLVSYVTGSTLAGTVASYLVSTLMAPDGPDTHGYRLSNLTTQSNTEGFPIKKVYGTSRIAGNLIWSEGIQETSHTQSTGGKGGGGGGSHTTYTYSASFAVGLCEGPIIGIKRIWADSVLIYDKGDSATADELAVSNQLGITIYTGSEDQEADPLMEADKGSGNVPAYRGLAYVVFDTLQLEKYGNRIPNITCEVVSEGSINLNWSLRSSPNSSWQGVAYGNGKYVAVSPASPYVMISTNGISWSTGTCPAGTWQSVTYANGLFVAVQANRYATYGVMTSPDGITWTSRSCPGGKWYKVIYGSDKFVAVSSDTLGGYAIMTSTDGISWSARSAPLSGWRGITYGNNQYVVVGQGASSCLTSPDGITWTVRTAINTTWYSVAYNDGLYLAVGSGSPYVMTSPDGITWTGGSAPSGYMRDIIVVDGEFLVVASLGPLIYHTIDGNNWTNTNVPESTWLSVTIGNGLLVAVGPSVYYGHVMTSPYGLIANNLVNLSSVISDLCNKVKMFNINISSISNTLHGYVRSQPMTAREALEPLLQAYQISAVESDYQLKFEPMHGTSDEIVSEVDLGANENHSTLIDKLKISRKQGTELPRRLEIKYSDKDGDYQQGNQFAQRIYK